MAFEIDKQENTQSVFLLSKYLSIDYRNQRSIYRTTISVQRVCWRYPDSGGGECAGHLPLPSLTQPGSQGGDLLQHGEVRHEQGQQPGGGPAAGQC